MLILDIETYQIRGKSYIWEFAAVDSITHAFYHVINGPMIDKARKLLAQKFNVRFFEDHHVSYCLTTKAAIVNNQEFYETIQRVIDNYSVIAAYNLNFDYRELQKQHVVFPEYQKKVCLWGSFINSHVNHKYVKYCYDHEYLSEKGYVQTSAEIAYRYITQDHGYIHQHTALADCWSELEIWEQIKKRKQKLESSTTFHNVRKRLTQLGY